MFPHGRGKTLVLAYLIAGFRLGNAQRCSGECSTPRLSADSLCSPHVQYRACQTATTWESQNNAAENDYFNALNTTGRTSTCLESLQKLACLRRFPGCEVGDQVEMVCDSACTTTEQRCKFEFTAKREFCGADDPLISPPGDKCLPLDYDGPEVRFWILAFGINVVFSFLAALGLNLQKHSLAKDAARAVPRSPVRQPLWIVGFLLILSGSLLDFVAFGLAPQSLLAPLAALSLVWNLLLAPRFHNEKITRANCLSTIVICLGVTSTVVFASHASPSYGLSTLIALYRKPAMIAYAVVMVLGLVAMWQPIARATAQAKQRALLNADSRDVDDGDLHGLNDSSLALDAVAEGDPDDDHRRLHAASDAASSQLPLNQPLDHDDDEDHDHTHTGAPLLPHASLWTLVCHGGVPGILGGQSVMFAKSSVELVKSAMIYGSDDFESPVAYVIVLAMFTTLFLQLKILNVGLARCDALVLIPIYQAFWIVSSIVAGLVYFEEYTTLNTLDILMFLLGVCVTVGGIVALVMYRNKSAAARTRYGDLEEGDTLPQGALVDAVMGSGGQRRRTRSTSGGLEMTPLQPVTTRSAHHKTSSH